MQPGAASPADSIPRVSSYLLKPVEQLETPPFYAGYTDRGMGEASRILHRFEWQSILPVENDAHVFPVLGSSWEATKFVIGEAGLIGAGGRGRRSLVVERFVIDDG